MSSAYSQRESRSHLEPVPSVKETEKRMEKKMSDDLVLSQLLKPTCV